MTADEHSPEAYRLLFALVGGALHVVTLVFVAASALVVPGWAVAVLAAAWATSLLSWRGWRRRPWAPLLAATAVAVAWIAVVTAVR